MGQFDALVDTDVRWTPYTAADIYARAPSGLSSLCLRDHEYWMTRKPRRGVPRKPGHEAVQCLPADPGPDCALSGAPHPQVWNI